MGWERGPTMLLDTFFTRSKEVKKLLLCYKLLCKSRTKYAKKC